MSRTGHPSAVADQAMVSNRRQPSGHPGVPSLLPPPWFECETPPQANVLEHLVSADGTGEVLEPSG